MAAAIAATDYDWRAEVRAFLDERLSDTTEAQAGELTRAVLDHFQDSEHFVRSVLMESVQPLVHRQVQMHFARTRRGNEPEPLVKLLPTADGFLSSTKIAEKAQKFGSRWEQWWEHAGGRHVRLMDMNRDDLLKAAVERDTRATTEHRLALLFSRLAKSLGPHERVRDHYTPEQIDQIGKSVGME